MRALFDTHLVLWSTVSPGILSKRVREAIDGGDDAPLFSAVAIWETAIKYALRKPGFDVDPGDLDRVLRQKGWQELPVTARHALAAGDLPPHHADPFDRMLIAQARVEGVPFYTADRALAVYGPPVVPAR